MYKGNILRRKRLASGLSVEQIAAEIINPHTGRPVCPAWLREHEKGGMRNPPSWVVTVYAKFYGLKTGEVYEALIEDVRGQEAAGEGD